MKIQHISAALAAILFCIPCTGALGAQPYSSARTVHAEADAYTLETIGDLTYRNYGDFLTVADCSESAVSVSVPAKILDIPVTAIEGAAFADHTDLEQVTIPEGVTAIGFNAFYGCASLTSVILPDSLRTMEENCFYGTPFYEAVESGAVYVDNWLVAYKGDAPESLDISGGTRGFAERCLEKASRVAHVYFDGIQAQWESIGGRSSANLFAAEIHFSDGTSLPSTGFTYRVQEDGTAAILCYEGAECQDLIIPEEIEGHRITAIADGGLSELTCISITLPETITSIGNGVFWGCPNLASITIPEAVRSIGRRCFCRTALKEVYIPKNVESIGEDCFLFCVKLEIITVDPDNRNYLSADGVLYDRSMTTLIRYPQAKQDVHYTVPKTVTSIASAAFSADFSDPGYLKRVTLPDGLYSIGDMAFFNARTLREIRIPDSVTEIGGGLFSGCSSLEYCVLPAGIQNLPFVDVGKHLNQAKGNCSMFQGCTSLKEVILPQSLTHVGNQAFQGCADLTGLILPESVSGMEAYVFEGCTSLQKMILPEGITEIGAGLFSQCTNLSVVYIPASVNSIGTGAFEECIALTDVYFGGTPEQWQSLTAECAELQGVTVHFGGMPEQTKGDLNGDDALGVTDVVILQRYLLGIDRTDRETADLNCDGSVNIFDLITMKRMLLKK